MMTWRFCMIAAQIWNSTGKIKETAKVGDFWPKTAEEQEAEQRAAEAQAQTPEQQIEFARQIAASLGLALKKAQ